MKYQVLKTEDFRTSRWTGGTTTQLAIWSQDSEYLERNFVWRLSTATCEKEESIFSRLPDFNRILVVLSGSVVLAHENVRSARLRELEQDAFDGAYRTKSFGAITDYNLMVRKGNEGSVEVIELSEENRTLTVEDKEQYAMGTQAFYCRDGYATVDISGTMVMLKEGEQLVIDYDRRESLRLSVMGEGHLIRCSIWYNYEEGSFGPTRIEKKPATAEDFRQCVFIANTQYRFSKYTNKRLKNVWYDEELQKGIRAVNRFAIADIVFFAGIALVGFLGAGRFHSPILWIAAFVAWFLLYSLLVAPAVYFLAVPKPVAAHIKDVSKLTPYERELREKQMNTNERVTRILNKYKFSGTAEYDEDGNRLDDLSSKKF